MSNTTAGEKFEEAQHKTHEIFLSVIGKIGLFSAGIISLSITFVGYLTSNGKVDFSIKFLHVPIYMYLFTSWIILVVALIFSLAYQWFEGKYMYSSYLLNWTKQEKVYVEKIPSFSKKNKLNYKIRNRLKKITFISFALGLVFLIIFAISSTYQLLELCKNGT